MILLTQTKAAHADCREHLDATGSSGSPIESYLTQHILVLLCAEVQTEIYNLVEKRSETLEDTFARKYISDSVRKILRSVKKADVANLLEMFDSSCRDALNSGIEDRDVTIYNNAVGVRHAVAHRVGTEVSFRELTDALACAERLLIAFQGAISVRPPETNS